MPVGLQIRNASGQVVFDTNDRVLGGVYTISTGTASGSHTPTLGPGQSAHFYFRLPSSWSPSGTASPWPIVSVSGNTIQWNFSQYATLRTPIQIIVMTY